MPTFSVPYTVTPLADRSEVVARGDVEVTADDETTAAAAAADWVREHDAHHDPRIDPRVEISLDDITILDDTFLNENLPLLQSIPTGAAPADTGIGSAPATPAVAVLNQLLEQASADEAPDSPEMDPLLAAHRDGVAAGITLARDLLHTHGL